MKLVYGFLRNEKKLKECCPVAPVQNPSLDVYEGIALEYPDILSETKFCILSLIL